MSSTMFPHSESHSHGSDDFILSDLRYLIIAGGAVWSPVSTIIFPSLTQLSLCDDDLVDIDLDKLISASAMPNLPAWDIDACTKNSDPAKFQSLESWSLHLHSPSLAINDQALPPALLTRDSLILDCHLDSA
ncbi:hypothetical protein JCM11641_007361 [Rhodosporidiobolus odoratus]